MKAGGGGRQGGLWCVYSSSSRPAARAQRTRNHLFRSMVLVRELAGESTGPESAGKSGDGGALKAVSSEEIDAIMAAVRRETMVLV